MCGSAGDVSAAAATDVPLISGAMRLAWLKALEAVGVTRFVATSGLGYDFVCHTGDLANFRSTFAAPTKPSWSSAPPGCTEKTARSCTISAPMPASSRPISRKCSPVGRRRSTLSSRCRRLSAKLAQSVERLGLTASVHPVAAAVVDSPGPVRLSYSEKNSLLAQISPRGLNARVGDKLAPAKGITLDQFCASVEAFPKLVKIDVEGSEVAVLRGARSLLSRPDRPAILFEHNPVALMESGYSLRSLIDLLPGYAFHYVDDLAGQKIPFGHPIEVEEIDWTCNLFAVPLAESSANRWASVLARAQHPRTPLA